MCLSPFSGADMIPDLGSNSMSLLGWPDGQGLYFGGYSIGSIVPCQLNQAQLNNLKSNKILFEPKSAQCSTCSSHYQRS